MQSIGRLIVVLALAAPLCAVGQVATGGDDLASNSAVSAADILERIERFRRLSPESAGLIHDGLVLMESAPAQLDLALIELFGPEPLRDVDGVQDRLRRLLDEHSAALDSDATRLLHVLKQHTDRIIALENSLETQQRELDRERRAHQETRETLEALRQIDRELQSDSDEGSDPDVDNGPHGSGDL